MSWASERRFGYAFGTAAVLLLLTGGIFFALYYEPATCFDGRENGEELGVDCGGSCERLCAFEVAPLKILWSRVFEVSPGKYNAVAYVENPNRHAGIRNISYKFQVLDQAGTVITQREGEAFITPGGISPIFESDIRTGDYVPSRTFFEFTSEPAWYRGQSTGQALSVTGTRLLDTATRPRIDAVLENNSLEEFKDVEVVGVVFASDGNAVAASRTVVDLLPKRGSFPLVFTWPRPFERRLEQCVVPAEVMLVVDTSGSMNDAGANPPQPLTAAKAAAASFVGRLEEGDTVGVVTFATEGALLQKPTALHASAQRIIEQIGILPREETGRTNIADGVRLGAQALAVGGGGSQHAKVLVLLTDGRANAPTEADAESLALRRAQEAKEKSVVIYTVGLGESVNHAFLEELATSPSHYFRAAAIDELESVYREISTAICERGPAVIDITPRAQESIYPQ